MPDLARHLEPVSGIVACHTPADRPFDIAALERDGDGEDRWSLPGDRMTYLASSAAVAAAEWARHASGDEDDRRIHELRLAPVSALDARRRDVLEAAGITDLGTLLDRPAAQRLAALARATPGCQALVVPSMAFLDRPLEAWNIVLFCEAVAGGVEAVLSEPRIVGRLCLEPAVRTSRSSGG